MSAIQQQTTEESLEDRIIDGETEPVEALKALDARSVDGAVPCVCRAVDGDGGEVTFEFTTIHNQDFEETFDVPDSIDGSAVERFVVDELGYEIQNLDMIDGEWFYVESIEGIWDDDETSFYDPPSGKVDRFRQSLYSVGASDALDTLMMFCTLIGALVIYPLFWIMVTTVAFEDARDPSNPMDGGTAGLISGIVGFCCLVWTDVLDGWVLNLVDIPLIPF